MRDALAIAAAVLAAITFALSAVAQQHAAATAPESESLRPSLLFDLLHRRSWLLGIAAMIAAYVMQATGLGLGSVALVEPIVATELVFAVPLAIRVHHSRPGRQEWMGVLLVAAGVTGFLVAADPSGGHVHAGIADWLLALLPAGGVIGVLLGLARGPQTRARAMLLGAAAGIANGMVALITKSFTGLLAHDLPAAFASWQLYTLIVVGTAGFLFAQSAYQAAPLAESLPLMDAIEPTISVVLAAAILGEHLSLSPLHTAIETACAVAAIAGVVTLGRSPVVLSIYEQQQTKREGERRENQPRAAMADSERSPSDGLSARAAGR